MSEIKKFVGERTSAERREYSREWVLEVLHDATYISAGQDGIVVKVVEGDGPTAIKMLKIFNPDIAAREVGVHQSAFHALTEHGAHSDTHAMVPQSFGVHTVDIPEEVRAHLQTTTQHNFGSKISVQIMEYVEAEEFLTYIERQFQILTRGSDRVIQRFNPAYTDVDGQERVRQKNVAEFLRVMTHASGDAAAIHPSIIEKLHATIRLLHKDGIYHRDLHERNVLVSQRSDGSYDVHLIDFGHSIVSEGSEEVFETSDGGRYMHDLTLVYRYLPLTLTQAQRREARANDVSLDIEKLMRRIKQDQQRAAAFDAATIQLCAFFDDQSVDTTRTGSWMEVAFQRAKVVSGERATKEMQWDVLLCMVRQAFQISDLSSEQKEQYRTDLVAFAQQQSIPTGKAQRLHIILT